MEFCLLDMAYVIGLNLKELADLKSMLLVGSRSEQIVWIAGEMVNFHIKSWFAGEFNGQCFYFKMVKKPVVLVVCIKLFYTNTTTLS